MTKNTATTENALFSVLPGKQAVQAAGGSCMAVLDVKKNQKDLYLPSSEPHAITVPPMNFIMIDGSGNPNVEDGEYSKAVEILYALSYTIKMSKKTDTNISGYVDFVVPPLEGLWWIGEKDKQTKDFDASQKNKYNWTSMIRQMDFVTEEVFLRTAEAAVDKNKKKNPELSKRIESYLSDGRLRLETYDEGLCLQCMHNGPYDDEPATIAKMDVFMKAHPEYVNAIGTKNSQGKVLCHHEIYLNDPRKTKPESIRTVLRHPVAK